MSVIMVNFRSTTVPFFFAKINFDMIYFFLMFFLLILNLDLSIYSLIKTSKFKKVKNAWVQNKLRRRYIIVSPFLSLKAYDINFSYFGYIRTQKTRTMGVVLYICSNRGFSTLLNSPYINRN